MVLSQAESDQVARDERIALALSQRGDGAGAKQFSDRAVAVRSPGGSSQMVSTPTPAFLSENRVQQIDDSPQDRGTLIAELRSQELAAAALKAEYVVSRDSRGIRRAEKIMSSTGLIAQELSKGSGPVPEGYELRIARASFPDMGEGRLRSRFGSGRQKDIARLSRRRDREAQAAADAAGFTGPLSDFKAQQHEAQEAGKKEAAVGQRLRFLASGGSKTATPAQVAAATVELERRGVRVISGLEVGGQSYDRGTGVAESPGQVIGVRNKEPLREVRVGSRLSPGVQRDSRGNLIYVRDGGAARAGEVFREMGMPEKKLIGGIDFGRPREAIIKGEGLLPKVSIPLKGEEVSRESRIYESVVTARNAGEASFAGLPTVQDGSPISFPATFRVVNEERKNTHQFTLLENVDAGGVRLSGTSLPGSNAIRGVRTIGEGLEWSGGQLEKGANLTDIVLPGAKPLTDATIRYPGEFLSAEGRNAQANPVTFGVGNAVIVGAGFGAVGKGIQLARSSAVAKEATVFGRTVRYGGAAARGVEIGTGVAMGGVFVEQTAAAVRSSPTPGGTLAMSVNQLAGFGGGYRLGSGGVQGVAAGVKRSDAFLFNKVVNIRTGKTTRALSPAAVDMFNRFDPVRPLVEMGNRGEVGGRSARQRAKRARPLDAGLRAAQSDRQRQPKFLVSRSPEGITRELRGQARARTGELRVVSQTIETRDVFNLEFANRGGDQIFVKRTIPTGRGMVDLKGPGELSPRIEPPKGRERPSQRSQVPRGPGSPLRLSSAGEARSRVVTSLPGPGDGVLVVVKAESAGRGKGSLVSSLPPRPKMAWGDMGGLARRKQLLMTFDIVTEQTAPVAFQNQRAESGFFRGSPADRRAGAMERLRAMKLRRDESVRSQLPALAGSRDVSVFNPGRRELSGASVFEASRVESGVRSRLLPSSAAVLSLGFNSRSSFDVGQLPRSRGDFRSRFALSQGMESATSSIFGSAQVASQSTAYATDQASLQDTAFALDLNRLSVTDTGSRSRERERPRVTPGELFREKFRDRPRRVPELVKVPEEKLPRFGELLNKERGGGEAGFQVLVRRDGRFELASNRVLTRGQALELGASIVDATPAQTFKVLSVDARAEGGSEPSGARLSGLLSKFREKNGSFMENQKRLIDSPGEFRDITIKGIRASAQGRRQLGRLGI